MKSTTIKPLKITVVTVVKNDEAYLESTITSVAKQDYKNIEYIIIDGGSTDGTINIINRNRSYITFSKSSSDKGIYDAMNKGISFSSGDYLIFLNSGDEFNDSNVISKSVALIHANPLVELVYGNSYEKTEGGALLLKKARDHRFIWYGMFTHHQSMFFKRDSIQDGYNLAYRIGADYALVAKTLSRSKNNSIFIPKYAPKTIPGFNFIF